MHDPLVVPALQPSQPSEGLVVTCYCAEWCGVCRDYRPGFLRLARRYPAARFVWRDVEDAEADERDAEIEDFPTLRIEQGGRVLFDGVLLPYPEHLARLLDKLTA